MRTDEVFHFWNEIGRIITGEITIDTFIEGFNEALAKECAYLLEQEANKGKRKRDKRYKKTKEMRQWQSDHRHWYVKDVYWNCYGATMPDRFPWRKWFKALIECENSVEKDK